jgi:hypothetical protein
MPSGGEGEGSSSFLKKRTKKLLRVGPSVSGEAEAKHANVFCFFFSKKKTFLSRRDCDTSNACAVWRRLSLSV